ncbi:MAG: hypothetical protein HY885_18615 [Deltaproteobacteria bacterium]|nr:hypothetical protein [Deltaproteobacteria bacterium]
MPEVALHGSLYFLSKDPDGPALVLKKQEIFPLKTAVINRYQTIILRDLRPENRKKSMYRGVKRSFINWRRLKLFAAAENIDITHVRNHVSTALLSFIANEIRSVAQAGEPSCVNCSRDTLHEFISDLGLCSEDLVRGWQDLCCEE